MLCDVCFRAVATIRGNTEVNAESNISLLKYKSKHIDLFLCVGKSPNSQKKLFSTTALTFLHVFPEAALQSECMRMSSELQLSVVLKMVLNTH